MREKKTTKKFAGFLAIVPLIAMLIGLAEYNNGYITTDFTSEFTSTKCVIESNGAAIKNANAELYVVVTFPDNKKEPVVAYKTTSDFDTKKKTFSFDFNENLKEKTFCQAMSLLYYDTLDAEVMPSVKVYARINYQLVLDKTNTNFHTWYDLSDSEAQYIPLFLKQKYVTSILDCWNNQYSVQDYYIEHLRLNYINNYGEITELTDIDVKQWDTYIDLLNWISDSSCRKLTENERLYLMEKFKEASFVSY